MVFQKKGGAATKRSFAQVNEKVPKKKVFEAEEEDDDEDMEDDSESEDSDDSDASDSGDAISKVNIKGKQTPIQSKSPSFLKTATKGQTQSPGISGKKNQLTGIPQKQSMQVKKEFLGKMNQGKGKMIEKAVEGDDSEDDDDEDDTDDEDSESADVKLNAKGKQTPQGKSSSLIKTPKGQAQALVLSSGKKNQIATPSPKQSKQNTMKEFPGMKGSAKKSFVKQENDDEDEDDEDSDEDDESEDESSQTPSALNKSAVKKEPNGKKDMHVSFELPQKGGAVTKKSQQNTPVQGKKNQQPATPAVQGKSAKQGKETPKGKKKPASDDDEDDDEDDDDDEDEDDLSDEEDDDDDDDDDDDEDDDEDEQEVIKKKISSIKKEVVPKKEKRAQNEMSSKSPEPKNKKGKTLLKQSDDSKEMNKTTQDKVFQESLNMDLQRKRERDARNLFIRGLPVDITIDEIKALSPDILDISLPKTKLQKKKGPKALFGFLEFASEKKAEENYVKLQKKKLRGQEIFIDFSGEKSKNNKVSGTPAINEKNINKRKLFVSALPVDVTIVEVAQLFPRSFSITLNTAPEYRNCIVVFHTDEDAAMAFKANENPKIRGRSITVLYSIEKGNTGRKHRGFKRPFEGKQNFQSNFQPKKKMKM